MDIYSGIYQWRNLIDNKVYIGQTINFEKRKKRHLHQLIKNKHYNPHLQSAWNKYGESNFIFEILQEINDCNKLDDIETQMINNIDVSMRYNIFLVAATRRGIKHSEKTKKLLSKALKGKKLTEEHKAKISPLGRQHSEETKQLMSEAQVGEKNHQFGKIPSQTNREKIRNALIQTHCNRNHEFTLENTSLYKRKDGRLKKHCKTCQKHRDSIRMPQITHNKGLM